MSFDKYKETIEEGDTVILYISAISKYAIKVVPTITDRLGKTVDNVFQTTYGALKVKDLIGKTFGTKVNLSRGWAHVLHPTPEHWTQTLPHRTQIIYTPDISMILMQLEIKSGSVVVESGTGSGSLTHALVRAVRPTGFVYSFDFHELRVNQAQKEFKSHMLKPLVVAIHRDVCKDGFGDRVHGRADAVFLDLPHPWLVIKHVIKAMKPRGGRFCSFSPCVEQVQRTCAALDAAGFTDLDTVECLQREYSVQTRSFRPKPWLNKGKSAEPPLTMPCLVPPVNMPGHTGYITSATLPPLWARLDQPDSTESQAMESQSQTAQSQTMDSSPVDENSMSCSS